MTGGKKKKAREKKNDELKCIWKRSLSPSSHSSPRSKKIILIDESSQRVLSDAPWNLNFLHGLSLQT